MNKHTWYSTKKKISERRLHGIKVL